MPLRRKLKKARDYVRDIFSSPGNSRPSTPNSPRLYTSSPPADAQQPGNPGAAVLPSQSNPQVLAGPLAQTPTQPHVNFDAGAGSQLRLNPTDATEERLEGTFPEQPRTAPPTGPTATSTDQVISTNEETSGSQGAKPTTLDITPEQTKKNEAQFVEKLPPGHPPGAVPDVTSTKWKGLHEFARVLGPVTNIFGPVKEMVDMFVGCVDMYEMAESAQTEYTALQVQVGGLLEDLAGYFKGGSSLTLTKSMESICESIKAELAQIQSKLGRNVGVRYLEAQDEVDVILGCYRRIELHLRRLSLNANLEMWKVVEEQTADSRTERMSVRVGWLPPSLPAWYNSAEGIELKRRGLDPN
ncbi:unnamed protein product [Rhizoctonia solani]|uniref:Uncharacterized protein n=1 Tax=Rhizoctonia solani TaxID=456999 RepID=A0A8H3BXU9_9AGAM|nr:unnamed protein product [Rhizoctonia solani]